MFCENCGAKMNAGAKFCSECGVAATIKDSDEIWSNTDHTVQKTPLKHLSDDKYYKMDSDVINAALRHNVISSPDEIIIYGGSYYNKLDSYFIFVSSNNLIFAKINEKNPNNDTVTKLDYNEQKTKDFYNPFTLKFGVTETDIGFKPKKIIMQPNQKEAIWKEVQRLCGVPMMPSHKIEEKPVHRQETTSSDISDEEIRILFNQCGNSVDTIKKVKEFTGVSLSEAKSRVDHACAGIPRTFDIKPTKRQIAKERIKENKANGVACCPKCGSTSLSANKKGFGIGKAAAGALIPGAGAFGLMAGNLGAKKVWVTCLNCGHRWKL